MNFLYRRKPNVFHIVGSEYQNHRTTEPQNHRTTEPQNHRTTEPQNHRTTEPQQKIKIPQKRGETDSKPEGSAKMKQAFLPIQNSNSTLPTHSLPKIEEVQTLAKSRESNSIMNFDIGKKYALDSR